MSTNYGQPKWSTQNDEAYVREAYYKLVWVYACVSLISHCTASIPWCLYRKRGKNITEIDEHPLLNMLNKRVNPYFSSKDFFDMWSTYLALQGKFYAVFNNIIPTQIDPLYPHLVKPIPDKFNFVSGFEYTIGGDTVNYDSAFILWSKFFDPLDMYNGLSPIRAQARTIDTENQAVDWNKTTLQNQAVPPGAITVVNPSPELQEKLRDEWLKRYGGPNNARVPLVLNAEKASYTNFGLSPVDMDFLEQRKTNRIEICAGFGVPSQLVGDPEGQTYANYEEAQKAFWENTIIPKYLDHMKDILNMNLVARYADNLYVEPNLDNVQALHESIDSISERTRGLWKDNIITREEARESLGYETTPDDKIYYNELTMKMFSTNQTEQATQVDKNENENENEEEQEQEEREPLKKKSNNTDYLNKWYDKISDEVKNIFTSELKSILKTIEKVDNDNILPKIEKIVKNNIVSWRKLLKSTWIAVASESGINTLNNLRTIKAIDNDYNVYNAEVQKYIDEIVDKKVEQITDTTTNKLKEAFAFYLLQGNVQGTFDVKIIIDYLYNEFSNKRCKVISNTEVTAANKYGALMAAKQSGIKLNKKWIFINDIMVRDTHHKMDGYPAIGLDDYFSVGKSMMKYPGDPNGEAKEIINCRCRLIFTKA